MWLYLLPVVLVLLARAALRRRRSSTHFPPGPSPLPIVGNIFDFPKQHLGREFATLSKKFGDVVYLRMLGQDIVILGSLKAARELLEKRSANYSDRPQSIMVQLTEYDWLTALKNYGPQWREQRRIIHAMISPDAVPQYEAAQSAAAHGLLQALLRTPHDLASHINFTISAMFMRTIYGIKADVSLDNMKYLRMLERMNEVGEAIVLPGNFPVEAFPGLRFLPAWFPGGGFKRWAAEAKKDLAYIVRELFKGARDVTCDSDSTLTRSMVSRILETPKSQEDKGGEDLETLCKEVAATLYLGGVDTLTIALGVFFYTMALYPAAQKAAQAELDAVVGTQRLPEFADRSALPYVSALVKELFRWHCPTPIGLPHRGVADDEYEGYFIPAGATVFVNVWAILRDPEVYHEPEKFLPERFLDSAGNLDVHGWDPADVIFGFGRRVCPGQHFAEAALFILCASVLSAFDVGPPVGKVGVPVEVKWEATDHLVVSHPKIHKYSIKPRTSHVEPLVSETA